jgi:hypothetical protein
VPYDAQKTFDLFLKNADCIEWRPLVDMFCTGSLEIGITLQQIQTIFSFIAII